MPNYLKVLSILALWVLYVLLLFQQCSRELCVECGAASAAPAGVGAVDEENGAQDSRRYAINFRWSDPEPYPGPSFEAEKERLQSRLGEDQSLEVTGLYYDQETPPAGAENIGLARAARVRQLLNLGLEEERIQLRARLIEPQDDPRTGYFRGVDFRLIAPEVEIVESVEELPDRIIIRFPYNSTERITNPKVETYLEELAAQVTESGEGIALTGHADNVGSSAYNRALSRRRAERIREVLVGYGVSREQIEVYARGETQPVASNDTEAGKRENRRVELRLLPAAADDDKTN